MKIGRMGRHLSVGFIAVNWFWDGERQDADARLRRTTREGRMTRRVAGNQTLRERRRSMSQQAPLQNRFGETVRPRWTRIQFQDRCVMLLVRENKLTNNVIFQRV